MRKMDKRGVLDQVGAIFIGIAAVSITAVVVFLLLANLGSNTQVAADTNATAAVNTITNAAADVPAWIPIIIVTLVGVLLLGLVALIRR